MNRVEIKLGTLTKSCFIIMPFSPIFNDEYKKVIRPAVETAGLTCIRGDEIYSESQIMEDIWKHIRSSMVIIAELTSRNTNVFYELGLAHALGKPVIIITRNEEDVPFDLKALRYLYYNVKDPFWGEKLKKRLVDMLQNLLREQKHKTVFRDINHLGEIKYEKKVIPAENTKTMKPSNDLAGAWQGVMKFPNRPYNCNLYLIQEGDNLSGTMIISYIFDNQLTVVQESVSGEIKDTFVNLYGTSYSFLQQGRESRYNLDTLTLQISPEGDEIYGMVRDIRGLSGEFLLKKEIFEYTNLNLKNKNGSSVNDK